MQDHNLQVVVILLNTEKVSLYNTVLLLKIYHPYPNTTVVQSSPRERHSHSIGQSKDGDIVEDQEGQSV